MNLGDVVDDFELRDDQDHPVRLSELVEVGPVVLFFYPAAMTTGCTAESCHFRDLAGEFAQLGASPVGISMDGVARQRQFTELHSFPFPLLSDPDGVVAESFDVRRRIAFLPVRRATFVIGRERQILGIVRSELRMHEHADRALEILRGGNRNRVTFDGEAARRRNRPDGMRCATVGGMKVGIVGGTGSAGKALAARLAAAGAHVLIGSRSAERGDEAAHEIIGAWPEEKLDIGGAENKDAAACEIVVLATPWEGAVATAIELADVLEGRTLVSMVNALARMGREFHALVPVRGSIAATVQSALPKVRVSAAFQHLPARELADLSTILEADVLVCADDATAAAETAALVDLMPGLRAVHCGSLASANAVEAMTAVMLNVNIRYKSHVALRLEGLHLPTASN